MGFPPSIFGWCWFPPLSCGWCWFLKMGEGSTTNRRRRHKMSKITIGIHTIPFLCNIDRQNDEETRTLPTPFLAGAPSLPCQGRGWRGRRGRGGGRLVGGFPLKQCLNGNLRGAGGAGGGTRLSSDEAGRRGHQSLLSSTRLVGEQSH